MYGVKHVDGAGAETLLAAQGYEVKDAGGIVTVRIWNTIMDHDPAAAWSGARRPGPSADVSAVLISNRFGTPLETVYFSAMA